VGGIAFKPSHILFKEKLSTELKLAFLPIYACSKRENVIWITIDQLIKLAHRLPIRVIWDAKRLAHVYVEMIV